MSTQDIAHRDPARELVSQIRSDQFKQQVALALPGNVSADRFVRVAVTALQTNPDIATCAPDTIFRALLRCAQDGLLPDGRQAAIVKRKNTASYMPMVGGIVDRAAEYGWTLRAKAVYAADEFDYSDEPEWIKHKQARPGVDRGELVAAYATARHRDGAYRQVVLHPEDVAKRRAKASTQSVWNEWPAQMWEKSAAHDLYDQLGMAESAKAAPLVGDIVTGDPVAAMYGPRADRPLLSAGEPMGLDTVRAASRTPDVAASERASSAAQDQQADPAVRHDATGSAAGTDEREPGSPFQPPPLATDAQKKKLDVLYGKLTGDDEDVKRQFCEAVGGREGERWPEVRERLTQKRASELIDHLDGLAEART